MYFYNYKNMLTRYRKKMNLVLNNYKKLGKSYLSNLNEKQLTDLLMEANVGYYNNDKPVMTDYQYDILKDYVEDYHPEAEINNYVPHTTITVSKNKVKLPFEMWSQDKVKKPHLVDKKLMPMKDIIISAKLDGISCMLTKEKGKEMTAYTRGNGIFGQEISKQILDYFELPNLEKHYYGWKSFSKMTFRGELLIKKDTFNKKYSKDFANARNFVAGVINAKTIDVEKLKDIDLVFYECIEPELTPFQQLVFMEKLGLKVVKCLRFEQSKTSLKLNYDALKKNYLDWRYSYKYEIDGLVVTENVIVPRTSSNPKHSWAFKMILDEQIAQSVVEELLWSPSKDGYLKPKIRIKPVTLCGAKITYVTVHNEQWRRKNGIDKGAIIEIIRSGDVIPKVHNVVSMAPSVNDPPSEYKVKMVGVDYVLINPEDNIDVKIKSIHAFFLQLDVAGLGRGNIKRIIEKGYNSIGKIINMSFDDFMTIDGFKEKMASKLVNNIKNALTNVELSVLMAASNIFGRGLGLKKIQLVLDNYPDILEKDHKSAMNCITCVRGFSNKSAEKFVNHMETFKKWVIDNNLTKSINPVKKVKYNMGHPLYGKSVVLTGFRDKNVLEQLKNIGANVATSVNSKTFSLIYKEGKEGSKWNKAIELGIPCYTLSAFKEKYQLK